jgi:ketosteroid isomerase-like protein
MSNPSLEARIRELESREAIRQLVARYCYVIDNRDTAGIGAIFAPDARFASKDGVMEARGREAIVQQFHGRFAVLGMTNHFTHDHLIDFKTPELAHGIVNSHAELVRYDRPMWVSLRYEDTYVCEGGHWYFGERVLGFSYYLAVEEYAKYLTERKRMRAYDEPQEADWPEGTETFMAYMREFGPKDE